MSPPSTRNAAHGACPLCGAAATPPHLPFCSQGCRDRDLLNWLDEGYRVPERPDDDDDGENARARLDSAPEPPL